MILHLGPVHGLLLTALAISGDVLTVDGIDFNLGPALEGGEAIPTGDTRSSGPSHARQA